MVRLNQDLTVNGPGSNQVSLGQVSLRQPLTTRLLMGLATTLILSCPLTAKAQSPPPASNTPTTAPPTATITTPERIPRPVLQLGSQGEAVTELQSVLILLGYYSGSVSGLYQEATQAAVMAFQAAAGITPDGIVGPATWSSLFPAPPGEANPPGSEAALAADNVTSTNAPTTPPTTTGTATAQPSTASPSTTTNSANSSQTTQMPILRPGMRGDAVAHLQERLKALGFYSGPVDGIFGSQTEAAVKKAQEQYKLEADGIVGPATWNAII